MRPVALDVDGLFSWKNSKTITSFVFKYPNPTHDIYVEKVVQKEWTFLE